MQRPPLLAGFFLPYWVICPLNYQSTSNMPSKESVSPYRLKTISVFPCAVLEDCRVSNTTVRGRAILKPINIGLIPPFDLWV